MKLIEPFMDALMLDIEATAAEVRRAGLRPVSIYMGGGTPTTLSAAQLERLCAKLEREFDLSALREYTVEAGRPDTISLDKLETLRARGVGRVSVNPQTMSDSVLEAIGRRHTAQDIVDALALVRKCGGLEVNMDLIAGLPTDTPEGFSRTLDEVLALCGVDSRITPCIDFGHLNARTLGGIQTKADYAAILDRMAEVLGDDRARQFHVHFSRIEYSAGGEKRHWTFADTQFGPEPQPLMELLAERKLAPVVICESAGTQAEDAQTMQQMYRAARNV